MEKTWLITGAARGLGREFARAALSRGDHVAGTARDVTALEDLAQAYPGTFLPLGLDVTDLGSITSTAERAASLTGRIDVLVNNAGYGLGGGVEEVSEAQIRAQMEVNFFGPLGLTRAVLPIMRAQQEGHIVQVSSIGGVVAFPNTGLYHASKWALEGVSDALAQEVASFGIRVTILELGPFRTEWNGPSLDRAEPMAEYDAILAERREAMSGAQTGTQPGDPRRAAAILMDVVDSPSPPLRLLLGNLAANVARGVYATRLAEWDAWDPVSRGADFEESR